MSFQGRDLRDRVHGHGNARAIGAVDTVKYALAAAPSLPASREGLAANRRATMRADKPRGRPQTQPAPVAGRRRKKRRPDRDAIRARRPNPHATARGPGER
jgi:hypothetical protein